ncbi:MAG TPA: hypothetical protein GXZ43_05850, partial [Clostridiaceae bacterium]|nr:hypothetical protein [Clostridiaceae bacterium]
MKKKLHLRIRAFVLVLLISLTTFVISPQQALADTEAASDEDMTDISADEEVTPDVSDKEEQNDIALPVNEDESQPVPGISDSQQDNTEDPLNKTNTNSTEIPSEPYFDQEDEEVKDELYDQDGVGNLPGPAMRSLDTKATVAGYTPEKYFEFDETTGTITGYDKN